MARPESHTHAVPLGLAGAAGLLMPLQALITSSAAGHLGGYFAAAMLSSLTSLVCLVVASLALPGARAGWRRFGTVWRDRPIPRWFLMAGLVGAYYMVAQAVSVNNIGLALFAVAVVGARTLTSIVIDMIGFSPAGKQPITRIRILGAALLVIGAVIASGGTAARISESPLAWISLVVALGAGILVSFQQSMNGRAGKAYGSTTTATALNYLASTAGLLVAMVILAVLDIESFGFQIVPLWWMYFAGPLGILFVVTGVTLVPRLGALVLGIGLVTGQLVGSLAMDLLIAPEKVGGNEIVGTIVTLLAVLVASWQPNGRPRLRTRKAT